MKHKVEETDMAFIHISIALQRGEGGSELLLLTTSPNWWSLWALRIFIFLILFFSSDHFIFLFKHSFFGVCVVWGWFYSLLRVQLVKYNKTLCVLNISSWQSISSLWCEAATSMWNQYLIGKMGVKITPHDDDNVMKNHHHHLGKWGGRTKCLQVWVVA